MNDIRTVEINITGIVQGVGFRPFLFNIARNNELKGYILNRGNAGVRLILQGESKNIEKFIVEVKNNKPKISFIEHFNVKEIDSEKAFPNLEIKKSEQGRGLSLTLPPDIAICDNCLNDMRNRNLRKYYNYPFIACAVCGPRFTTVKELPYDRERTTMIKFPFCDKAEPESCIQEYYDFNNRRFHAQTYSCSVCGPNYQLYNKSGNVIEKASIKEILKETSNRINNGEIIAVKGIGGVHLVCLADDDIILKLRTRKGERKFKPFALMVPNFRLIEKDFYISEEEREILTSFRRPIVLLERKNYSNDSDISKQVAPGLNNVGVMFPYSGIHHLLFDYIGEKPLVYTSGNKSNIPMGIENDMIFNQLQNLADVFLLHNRPIFQRADDSVLRIHDNKVKLIRRSRGYVPEYLLVPFDVEIQAALSTGPELAVTGAILRGNRIFPTQHIGNVTHLETYEFLKNALVHMKNLLQIRDSEIEFITCDLHPAFITTKLAKELASKYNVDLFQIQHHFAHVLSLMAENNLKIDEKIVGISVDGVGYGDDGKIWGGEILLCSYDKYQRVGHLEYQPMIGGDRCTKYPARMTASIILKALDSEEAIKIFKKIGLENDLEYKGVELNALISQFEMRKTKFSSENIPLTSSTGRIFDVISYLLGTSNIKTYRGEPAMRLEGLASKGNPENIDLHISWIKQNGKYLINTTDLILELLTLLEESKYKKEDIAARFQINFGKIFANLAIKIAKKYNINKIGLTGGVAYNFAFSNAIKEEINQAGYQFLEHHLVAPGDAGISTGQLIAGFFQFNKKR
ncbi:MAG: carbamoyltransferase HypF [Promethearchaeota archaeon]